MHLTVREWAALIGAGIYSAVAGVNTMPVPGSEMNAQTLYKWFYDWTHCLINSPQVQVIERHFHIEPNGAVTSDTTKTTSPVEVGK
jgi:hypothetical protein